MSPTTNLNPKSCGHLPPRGLLLSAILIILILNVLTACGTPTFTLEPTPTPAPTPPPLADTLILYDWEEDIPPSILAAFTEEYGVEVTYLTYETQLEALAMMKQGEVYDVVVFDNIFIPRLVADGLLAQIDYGNVPNFENIAPNFKDLVYDPHNQHSIPFNWGTTGLLVRRDLVGSMVTDWADLWELHRAGKVAIRPLRRDILGLALKSLGYSVNSESPAELEAALKRLLEIRENIIFVDSYAEAAIPLLASGEAVALVGWAEDALAGRAENEAITYILPEEGSLLWGDNFVIPANSPRKYTAELFLNFLLRPEISAQITNQNFYATPNEAAYQFIDPELLNDSTIFPPTEMLENAEIMMPLSQTGEQLYDEIWERFMNADG